LFQPFVNILDQAVFKVVHVDSRGDVHGRDEAKAIFDAASSNDLFNFVGDVDHFAVFSGLEDEIFGVAFHFGPPWLVPLGLFATRFGGPIFWCGAGAGLAMGEVREGSASILKGAVTVTLARRTESPTRSGRETSAAV